jgi:hypothetical protein
MVCVLFLLESAKDWFLGADPRTTCATTCLVWNDFLTNSGTLGICLVQEKRGRVWLYLGFTWCKRGLRWGNLSRMQE